MRRLIIFFIVISLIASNGTIVFANNNTNIAIISQKKIIVYLKPDVTVELNNIKQVFYDSMGIVVYPIIYNGSTYLPVRAISGLMNEPIEWDGASKTVFIGKTLSDPNKVIPDVSSESASNANAADSNRNTIKPKMVYAYLKPDVLVMFDFVLQSFCDANGVRVYPIIYNGTTYLPIRAVSELMNEPIEWDGTTKTVIIGDGEDNPQENIIEEEEELNYVAQNLKMIFEKEEMLYYEATTKTTSLKEADSLAEKQLIAETISENYKSAQRITIDIKMIDTLEFTKVEKDAYEKLITFAESTEYYILVLENIAYLAAQDTDYSMLAETFLYFAMESQGNMEAARKLIQKINQ